MKRIAILASVVVMAMGSAFCANSPSSSIVAPSAVEGGAAATAAATAAKGGGGGGGKGKPGGGGTTGGGSGSLSVVMVDDQNGNNAPNWADTITFNISTTATSPWVQVDCYQGTSWVYTSSVGYFDAYPWAKHFVLSSNHWPAATGATCTAKLYTTVDGSSINVLTTLSFDVGA
jgi:hypothetical protein